LADPLPDPSADRLMPPSAAAPESVTPAPIPSYLPPIAAPPVIVLPAPYAGFWLRAVAYLIDAAIMGVVFGAIVAIAVGTLGMSFFRGFIPGVYNRPANPMFPAAILGVIFILIPITVVVTWLYFAKMESSERQGTLGKIALGLFVTDAQGRRISFARASGRFFAKFITGLIPFFIGYIMAGFTEKKQALHDMIAGCLVLKKP
jgi:uncharacterized RDD family membrane protein YckC